MHAVLEAVRDAVEREIGAWTHVEYRVEGGADGEDLSRADGALVAARAAQILGARGMDYHSGGIDGDGVPAFLVSGKNVAVIVRCHAELRQDAATPATRTGA